MTGLGTIERVTREFVVEWGEPEATVLGGDDTAEDQELQRAVQKALREIDGIREAPEENVHPHGWMPGEPL
jgi:hypothetical protein